VPASGTAAWTEIAAEKQQIMQSKVHRRTAVAFRRPVAVLMTKRCKKCRIFTQIIIGEAGDGCREAALTSTNYRQAM